MSATSSSASTTIREATLADMEDVVLLLSARDGQVRDPNIVKKYLWNLDPESIRVWLAYAGDQPVGITALYLREMVWPSEAANTESHTRAHGGSILLAGYWAHLYVEPRYRKQMIYPQLVLAMLRGMKAAGVKIIFTATRQPQVAEAHQKLGFALVGSLPLRLRPLRPFRLLAKHKQIPILRTLSPFLDFGADLILRRKLNSQIPIEDVSLNSFRVEQIVAMMNEGLALSVRQKWTPHRFRLRFSTTLDGSSYRIRAIHRKEQIVVATIFALVERGNNIRAGVILAFVAQPEALFPEVCALLADAERYAYNNKAELMLSLGDSFALPQLLSAGRSYLISRSENYHLLVYPKTMAQAPFVSAQIDQWAFEFADHDAF